MKERYPELDALRGLAALSVVLFHLGFRYFWPWLNWLPIRFMWAGHQAVILFFVLSGFVLSLPYHRGRPHAYPLYVTRRIARIWLPFIVMVILAFGWRLVSHENSVPFFNRYRHLWETPVTLQLLLSHLGLIVGMDDRGLIPTAWSLVHEMRISLVFPLLMLGVVRRPWPVVLGAAFLSSLAAGLASLRLPVTNVLYMPLSHTIYFLGMFLVGSLVAEYRAQLISWTVVRSREQKAALLLLIFFLYTYGENENTTGALLFLGDWGVTLSCAALIIVSLSFGKRLLAHPLPVFLGHISYSLYLVHLPIICALPFLWIRIFPEASVLPLFPIMLVVALLGGVLFWYLIERPVVAWCKTVGRGLRSTI